MPSLRLTRFAGLRPRVSPRLLPDDYAQISHNTRLVDGSLRPWRRPRRVLDTVSPASIVKVPDAGGKCGPLLTFDHCVSVIDFPAPGSIPDLDHFVVWHHNGQEPQRYFPARNLWAPLIVPAPDRQLQLRKLTTTQLDTEPYRGPDQRAYTYTWVDQFGVESPPAPPSKVVRSWDDEEWELTNFAAPPANAVAVRIYRTAPSFDDGQQAANPFDTSFQLLAEIELSAFSEPWVDRVRGKDLELGTLLTAWDLPPADMDQVVGTEQGYLVGFKDNDIYVSERYEAHNWPEQYRLNVPDRIVALVATGDWVYVMTTGPAYRFRPEFVVQRDESDVQLQLTKYDLPLPAMGRLACCPVPFGALYVSRQGLVALTPQDIKLITPQRMGIDDWLADWAPNLIAWHKGKVYAWRAGTNKAWVLDLPESGDELEPGDLVTVDIEATAVHQGRDGLLYIGNGDGVHVVDEGAWVYPWRWRSKIFRLPALTRFNCVKAVFDGEVRLRLIVDGRTVFDEWLRVSDKVYRLPMYRRGLNYEIELAGEDAVVHEVHLATSVSELGEA